jgi:periplasmic protein TonB
MNTTIRTRAASLLILASLCGCSVVGPVTSSVASATSRIFHPNATRSPVAPPSPGLDAYKTQVAYHVMRHNPQQTFSGRLPAMLPAIVVVNVTVDKDGEVKDVEVQRSRDPDASRVAVDSMKRSGPLPKPVNLLANNADSLTFSETFLFNDQHQFQLRSIAGPQ